MKIRCGHLVSFGLGGHMIELDNGMLSGYDDPTYFVKELQTGHYANYDLAGVPVIDKRELLNQKPSLAYKSPLPKVGIDTIERFDKINAAGSIVVSAILQDPGNGFQLPLAMGLAHDGPEPGPLDYVPIADFVQWWKDRGARIGKIVNNDIVWEV